MRLTAKKLDFIADQLSNNENASDAELILHIAGQVGAPIGKVAKLVKSERVYFLNNIVFDYAKSFRKYLR